MKRTFIITLVLVTFLTFSAMAQMQIKNSADAVLMHITQTGSVGIGIGNTTPGQTLSVAGTVGIKGGTSAFYTVLAGQNQTANLTYNLPATMPASTGLVLEVSSISGSTATLQWATDDGTTYTAGTGINISGNIISATNTTAMWNANQIQNRNVASTAPTNGQVLKWNNTTTQWEPATDENTTYTAGTGLTLTGTTFAARTTEALWNANQIQTKPVSTTAPTTGQVLKFDGTNWKPDTDNGTNYTAGNDIDITGNAIGIQSQLDYVSIISRASANLTLQTTTSGHILLSPAAGSGIGFGTANPTGNALEIASGKSLVINGAGGKFTIVAN